VEEQVDQQQHDARHAEQPCKKVFAHDGSPEMVGDDSSMGQAFMPAQRTTPGAAVGG
jgi:hypothetical protein